MVIWYLAILGALVLERGFELMLSRRNAAWAFSRGGIEFGQKHFLLMKLLHTGFFCACAAEVTWLHRPFKPALGMAMAALLVLSQGLRYWAVMTLGRRWNVRVIVIPGEPAVTSGPYRYVKHPNYAAVVIEGIALPLLHAAWITAIGFSVLNGAILAVRIRCEEQALAQYSNYQERLGNRCRFLPTLHVTPTMDGR